MVENKAHKDYIMTHMVHQKGLAMILSIQSNVMHGYVGNRASLPLYQAFGIETDHLDTVRLAAHPGHGTTARDVLDGKMMGALFDDYLRLPDTEQPSAIHIGYFGALEQVLQTANFVTALKARYKGLILLLDPVFGDNGRRYISDDIINAVISHLLPLADIITPNQFELEVLSDMTIRNQSDARNALSKIGATTTRTIMATGIQDGTSICDMLYTDGMISEQRARLREKGVSGSGDAFAALFLSHIIKGDTAQAALNAASALTHHMIAQSKSPLTLNIASGLSVISKS